MVQSKRIAPPYSQIVIVDPHSRVEVPDWKRDAAYVSTDTCILFACLAEVDGETDLTLGRIHEVDPGSAPVFEGVLKTPSRAIALETVEGDPILEARTLRLETSVKIWANSKRTPDKVIVGIA